jgi:NAD(P)-dependent dehydrogenase (short-subunit alcohol dehydrogenase family)
MRLKGKVAIVTGGGRGIGRACSELFAAEGAQVIVGDIDEAEFDYPGIESVHLDATKMSDWKSLIDHVIAKHGKVDVLMNNAGGVGSYLPIGEIEIDDWKRIIDLNQNSTFYGMRAVIPHMKKAGRGSIINVSSIWGLVSAPGVAAYTASKGAVHLMSKNAALSYVGDGIRVNSIHPGIIETPMIAAQDAGITQAVIEATPMKRLGTPNEIAYGALYLASDESSFTTGSSLIIDGGYTAG